MRTAVDPQASMLGLVRRIPALLEGARDTLLANLIMTAEVPAPPFDESDRINFLKQRFTECGLQNCSSDEVGNGLAILPGRDAERNILVTAHVDTPFARSVNHTLCVDPDRVTGPGVADNSLGVAVLATLPTVLERLEIRLRSNLILMGASRSLGRGNLQGLRFFLANNQRPLAAGVILEGARLGRLNYGSLATLGGEIVCQTRASDEPVGAEPPGAIVLLNHLIERLEGIDLPIEAHTRLVLGEIHGGISFKSPARKATLRFQARSESGEVLDEIERQIREIVRACGAEAGASVGFEEISRSNAGGLTADHAFVLETRRIMAALGITPLSEPYSTAVSSFIERGVPAVTVGISTGSNLNETDEWVAVEPMLRGVAQLIGMLLAIDGGCCE